MRPKEFNNDHGVNKLALEAGVSAQTVSRKLKQGKTPEQILSEAIAWKEKQATKSTATPSESFTEAQARKERALASLRELELAEKNGQLVDLHQVNAWVSGCIIRARDILLRIAPELRDRLSQESDPITIHELIDKEIRRALNELATYTV